MMRFLPMRSTSSLADAVVDLVRAGVQQVFALEIDLCAAEIFREALGEEERRGASGIVAQQVVEALLESLIALGLLVGLLEFFERRHEGFGDVASAVGAEAARDGLRVFAEYSCASFLNAHFDSPDCLMKSRTFCGSFLPG